jgi:hypothetical protein
MSKLAHAGYIAVVLLLIGLLLRFGAKDMLGWFMGIDGEGYVRVHRETDLVDPASDRVVGTLRAGIVTTWVERVLQTARVFRRRLVRYAAGVQPVQRRNAR